MATRDHRSIEDPSASGRTGSEKNGASSPLVDDVIITHLLAQRLRHAPDYRAESEALTSLAEVMATAPDTIFQELVETALRLCGAQSAGISISDRVGDAEVFRWWATAGAFAPLRGQTLPRHFSPCGVVVDRDALQLMKSPVVVYPYIAQLSEPVHEVLLAPFHHRGLPVGTVWVVAHDPGKHFDAEDARVTTSLSRFVAAAWQAFEVRREMEISRDSLQKKTVENAHSRLQLAETREQAELARARFTAFFEQSPFYAGMLAADGSLVEISRRALEICGYRREDVVGKLFWDTAWWRHFPESQAQVRLGLSVASRGEPFKAQLSYCFADGIERITDFGLSPVFDRTGRVSFVIATGVDITDRVRTERELAVARRRLDSALIAAEMGVYEWQVGSDRLFGDANFQKLFAVKTDATGSAPLESYLAVLHPDDRQETMRRIDHSVRTGENFEMDYRVILPRGERWINSRGRMIRNAGGETVSFCGVVLDITARKRAEDEREAIADELRRLSAIHETVLSATNDFAYVFDRQGRFLYANRQLLQVWAKTLDQIVGKTCYELGYPDWHADMHMREIEQVIASRQPIRGEVPFTGGSGVYGVYDYIFTPVFGEDGEVELIAGTTRDVTERRRGEDRDRFLVALDDATRPLTDAREIVDTSAQLLGDHLDANRCAYADVEADENTFNLTGDYNRDVPSIVGRYRFEQFGDECLRQMRAGEAYVVEDAFTDPRVEPVRAAYEATQIRSVVCVPLHKAGKFVAAMAIHRTQPHVWQSGEIELLQLVANRCWESIERARVIRALAFSEQQLRLAVETGRLGVWQLEVQAEVLTCSAQCKANYGRAADSAFTYAELWRVIHPEDAGRVRAEMRRAIEERTELDVEYQAIWPDGSVHWVLVRGQASYDADGSPDRMVGVSLDITARKQAEREIARLHEEAVRGSRAKDDFLAALSHELRTPLNPVLLLASESAADPELPPHVRETFEVIRKNVELEARLIDDLLDLTSITRGKLVIRKQTVAVHEILAEAATALRGDFAMKEISLDMNLTAARDVVSADRVRLLQIFSNLLRNAVKFTPIRESVVVTTRVADSGMLEIDVTDTGIGMTAEELERAFGAFQQGDHAAATGAHRFGGLGLGLAIARQLVEAQGGMIYAVSEGRNKGASFIVRLPLTDHAQPAAATSSPRVEIRATDTTMVARILLIEDHEPTRNALRQLLHRRRYQVTSVASVAEAHAVVLRSSFDFVISDIGLPDGDGATLMAELRDRFGLRGIALTGYGMEQDLHRYREAGFAAHLIKPVRIESLDEVLAGMMINDGA